jgi:hypothetical protein
MTDIEISFIGMNISVFSVRSALPLATEGTQEFLCDDTKVQHFENVVWSYGEIRRDNER